MGIEPIVAQNGVACMKTHLYNWTPRISRNKIVRLYESDANGMLDEELLEDIGFSIYMRCIEGQEVMDAVRNMRVKCRRCGKIIIRKSKRDQHESLRCSCGWNTTWGHYRKNTFSQNMCNGNADPFFREYIKKWENAKTAREKMILIDWLIHQFHIQDHIPGRAVGPNIIAGTKQQVAELIFHLAYGKHSVASVEAKEQYRKLHNDWRKKLIEKLGGNNKTRLFAQKIGIMNSFKLPMDVLIDLIAEIDIVKLEEFVNEYHNESVGSHTCRKSECESFSECRYALPSGKRQYNRKGGSFPRRRIDKNFAMMMHDDNKIGYGKS